MRPQQAIVDANFIVPRLNMPGLTQPTAGEKAVFADESTIDVAANPKHKAADRQHLTMNDKVFAARYGVATIEPVEATTAEVEPEAELESEPEPEPEVPVEEDAA